MNQINHLDLDQTCADAAKWRELTSLLRAKAYNAMTPEEIAGQFPDLRQLYREVNHRQNGHGRSASHQRAGRRSIQVNDLQAVN